MTEIIFFFIDILLLAVTVSAYFLALGALFSNRVEKTQGALQQMTGRSFLLGLVNFLFFGIIALILLSVADNTDGFIKAVLTTPALVITAFLAVLLSAGLAGVANVLGVRLFPDHTSWQQTVWGSAILTFACALPFVGWFLLLPYVGLTGIGATILGFFQRGE